MNLLNSKEKAALRGIAQRLKPAIHIGKNGVSESATAELRRAFQKEELIKVAFKAERDEIAHLVTLVESATESQCVGGVGKKRSFYRALPEESASE